MENFQYLREEEGHQVSGMEACAHGRSGDTPARPNYCEECACARWFRYRTRGDNDACWQQEVRCKSFVATALMSPRITSNQSVRKEKRIFFECVTQLHLLSSCRRFIAGSRQLHELVQAALRLQLLELILPRWIEQDEQQWHGHTFTAAAFVCSALKYVKINYQSFFLSAYRHISFTSFLHEEGGTLEVVPSSPPDRLLPPSSQTCCFESISLMD